MPAEELESSRIDLALGYFSRVPGALPSQVLLRERFVCLTARDHPAAGVWSPHLDADGGHRWLRRTISQLRRTADLARTRTVGAFGSLGPSMRPLGRTAMRPCMTRTE